MDSSLIDPPYIECIGLPGSGKTTLVKAFIESMADIGVKCQTRQSVFLKTELWIRRWGYGLSFILKHPFFTLHVIIFCFSIRLVWDCFRVLHVCIAQYRAMHSDADVIIYDQGVINTLLSLPTKQIVWKRLRSLYDVLFAYRPILIVFINTNPQVALRRAQTRSQRGHFTEREPISVIHQRYDHYLQAFYRLRDENAFPLIEIDGSRDLDQQLSILRLAFRRL